MELEPKPPVTKPKPSPKPGPKPNPKPAAKKISPPVEQVRASVDDEVPASNVPCGVYAEIEPEGKGEEAIKALSQIWSACCRYGCGPEDYSEIAKLVIQQFGPEQEQADCAQAVPELVGQYTVVTYDPVQTALQLFRQLLMRGLDRELAMQVRDFVDNVK